MAKLWLSFRKLVVFGMVTCRVTSWMFWEPSRGLHQKLSPPTPEPKYGAGKGDFPLGVRLLTKLESTHLSRKARARRQLLQHLLGTSYSMPPVFEDWDP